MKISRQITGFTVLLLSLVGHLDGQCPSSLQLNDQIEISERDNGDTWKRIRNLYDFKTRFEHCQLRKDSVYAKILHKIGILEYQANNNQPTENSFAFTAEAVRINTSGIKTAYPAYATKSFSNLAILHLAAGFSRDAIRFSDSAILYASRYPAFRYLAQDARETKARVLFQTGDYQRAVDEATLGLRDALSMQDTTYAMTLLNLRAECYLLQGDKTRATDDALKSITWLENFLKSHRKEVTSNPRLFIPYFHELGYAYKVRAFSSGREKQNPELDSLIRLAKYYYLKTGDSTALSKFFNDAGAHYFKTIRDFKIAKEYYLHAMKFGKDSELILAHGYLNLGAAEFPVGNYAAAEKYYLKMLSLLGLTAPTILANQQVSQLMAVPYKQLVHVYLNNKTELLLGLFKRTNDTRYLKACLSTAMTTDSVIQEMRREQSEEPSKLFWRNKTREFFTNALEASFLAKDPGLAFYFMERSRAVILADKLNELGASSLLPDSIVVREALLKKGIANEESILRLLPADTRAYDSVRTRLIEAKHLLNAHIALVERKYPAYFHYKYSNDILSYAKFKQYLQRAFLQDRFRMPE